MLDLRKSTTGFVSLVGHRGALASAPENTLPSFAEGLAQGADVLERTLAAVEEKFGPFLSQVRWVNFGGGHHVTKPNYDVDLLCRLITDFQGKYGTDVYIEPGEAVALNAGILVATVLEGIFLGRSGPSLPGGPEGPRPIKQVN